MDRWCQTRRKATTVYRHVETDRVPIRGVGWQRWDTRSPWTWRVDGEHFQRGGRSFKYMNVCTFCGATENRWEWFENSYDKVWLQRPRAGTSLFENSYLTNHISFRQTLFPPPFCLGTAWCSKLGEALLRRKGMGYCGGRTFRPDRVDLNTKI